MKNEQYVFDINAFGITNDNARDNEKTSSFTVPKWMYENVERGRRDKNNHLVLAEDWDD